MGQQSLMQPSQPLLLTLAKPNVNQTPSDDDASNALKPADQLQGREDRAFERRRRNFHLVSVRPSKSARSHMKHARQDRDETETGRLSGPPPPQGRRHVAFIFHETVIVHVHPGVFSPFVGMTISLFLIL